MPKGEMRAQPIRAHWRAFAVEALSPEDSNHQRTRIDANGIRGSFPQKETKETEGVMRIPKSAITPRSTSQSDLGFPMKCAIKLCDEGRDEIHFRPLPSAL
jgi:hypothetical protein